jgi:hypothetical protein
MAGQPTRNNLSFTEIFNFAKKLFMEMSATPPNIVLYLSKENVMHFQTRAVL